MTENQANYIHYSVLQLADTGIMPGSEHFYDTYDTTLKCVLHGTRQMHITLVTRSPKDQPNRKIANKLVDERMEEYLLTGKKGITVDFEDVINSMNDCGYYSSWDNDPFRLIDSRTFAKTADFTFFKSSALKNICAYCPAINKKLYKLFKEIINVSH